MKLHNTSPFLNIYFVLIIVGEVAERFKAHAWKACGSRKGALGFKSRPLRELKGEVGCPRFLSKLIFEIWDIPQVTLKIIDETVGLPP